MNQRQWRILEVGGAVVVLMLFFPPWQGNPYFPGFKGWHFIGTGASYMVDWPRLGLQLGAVAVVVSLLVLRAGRGKDAGT